MKKHWSLYLTALTIAMLSSCNNKTDYEYHGFLYSDSTMTMPVCGAVLTFGETGINYSSDAGYRLLGSTATDSNGYWKFMHVHNQNSESQNAAKWSRDKNFLMITCEEDTLYWYYEGYKDTLKLYPRCSWNPYE